ncbi:uncharacterized protein LOC103969956 isoform X1 [Musa acuminata AAA Group]|uniref:uncharacterized protein LOC103969956 isoform X1 n=1 Tax=Musa acuminata AAA Group TaxID=214697 RepID=UPI0031CFEFA4
MTPNEQTKGSVPGDGGLRMGKKNKQKKIPQRGLGVAQLEKLRLEEQQKKGASSSSDPSTQGFGFPPPPPPPQQQQQPYFPLATDEGVMRPRVALVVPVNSYPVISMPPPRPVAQDTSMPVLWNAGDPNACDGEAFAKSFGFHVPPGSDLSNTSCRSRTPMTLVRSIHLSLRCHGLLRSTAVLTSPCCLICRRTWHHQRRPWSPLQTKPLRIATTCYLAGESESESERKSERGSLAGSGHVRFTPTTSPVKQLTPLNSLHLQMELLVSEETLRVPVFIPTEATKKMAAFSPCVPSALPPTHHSINPILVMLVRQESGALCFTPFLRSSLSSSSLIELACLLQDERPYYSFIPIGPSRSETATSERRGEAADGIDLNLKL